MNYEAEAIELLRNRPGFAREVARQVDLRSRPSAGMTSSQRDVLDFIRGYIRRKGVSPSYDDIRDGLAYASKSNIHRIALALEERGYISRLPGRARSIILRSAG